MFESVVLILILAILLGLLLFGAALLIRAIIEAGSKVEGAIERVSKEPRR